MEYRMLTEVRTEEAKRIRRQTGTNPKRAKMWVVRKDHLVQALQTGLTNDHYLLAIPKSTSTQYQFTKGNLMAYDKVKLNPQIAPTVRAEHHNCMDVHYIAKGYPITETSPKSTQKNSLTSIALSGDSLAKLLASLENEEALKTPEGRYSLTLREYCEQNNLDYLSLKTLKDFSVHELM